MNESLPIFLDDVLGGGLAAVIVSTTMIVIFGEIIPQAVRINPFMTRNSLKAQICVRYGLAIGGACAPLVFGLMILFSPIAFPIAKLLDYVLGREEGHTYGSYQSLGRLDIARRRKFSVADSSLGTRKRS